MVETTRQCARPVEPDPTYAIRRGQIWLGTLVDIAADGASSAACETAIRRAFKAIARVHDALSAFTVNSELSHVNRSAHRARQWISDDLRNVLSCALQIARHSDGAFDPTVGARLVALGFLPSHGIATAHGRAGADATWRDVDLDDDGVHYRQPLTLDLDGIAKGYAVDCAIDALRADGMTAALVNAGGDLRVFGERSAAIHVRTGGARSTLLPLATLADGAVATSAYGGRRRSIGGRWATPLIDPRGLLPVMSTRTVSVIAPSCMVADALTKVLTLRGRAGARILRRYDAAACIFSPARDRWRCTRLPAATIVAVPAGIPANASDTRPDPPPAPTSADQARQVHHGGAHELISPQRQI